MKNLYIILFFTIFTISNYAQKNSVNSYQYIIVPERFNFLKENNQYQTSSLTKFLLEKNGFNVYFETDVLPEPLQNNRCNAMLVEVVDVSSMFRTKVEIILKDCYNKVLYTSKLGESREKDYKKSFQEAIRNAHANMSDVFFNKELKDGIVSIDTKKTKTIEPEVIINTPTIKTVSKTNSTNNLFAQPIENGFQLINLKPEVVFVILNTSLYNVYIIEGKNGILFQKDTTWYAEYIKNRKLVSEAYQIKF